MTVLDLVSYNMRTYRRDNEHDRYAKVEAVISDLVSDGPSIVVLQELGGGSEQAAGDQLRHLADVTGMRCDLGGGRNAVAATPGGHHDLALGIMWSPGIKAVPGTWDCMAGGPLWHAAAWCTLDLGGPKLVAASRGRRRPATARRTVTAIGGWIGGCSGPGTATRHGP